MNEGQVRLARKILARELKGDKHLWNGYKLGIAGMVLDAYVDRWPGLTPEEYDELYYVALTGADNWLAEMTKG